MQENTTFSSKKKYTQKENIKLNIRKTLGNICNDIHPNPGPLSNNSRCELRNISIVNMNVNSLRTWNEKIHMTPVKYGA
jgi:hypothetical protein